MAKKLSGSSRRGKLIRVKAEDIFGKPLSKQQQEMLSRLAARPESEIDYSDIPELTDEQLAQIIPARLRTENHARFLPHPDRHPGVAEV